MPTTSGPASRLPYQPRHHGPPSHSRSLRTPTVAIPGVTVPLWEHTAFCALTPYLTNTRPQPPTTRMPHRTCATPCHIHPNSSSCGCGVARGCGDICNSPGCCRGRNSNAWPSADCTACCSGRTCTAIRTAHLHRVVPLLPRTEHTQQPRPVNCIPCIRRSALLLRLVTQVRVSFS